jgi:hypothetical protein
MATDAQERGHSATLLCVWILINLAFDADRGTSFMNPVEGSLLVSLLLVRNLEILNCALLWPTNQLVTCVIYLSSINLHIHILAEALS